MDVEEEGEKRCLHCASSRNKRRRRLTRYIIKKLLL